jgi:hypothetical protein
MMEFKSALINAGYRVSNFHKDPLAIKTDAPNSIIWDIIRAYRTTWVSAAAAAVRVLWISCDYRVMYFACGSNPAQELPSKKKKQSLASIKIMERVR